ncbi:Bacterial alpha-L-rhamnosidase [compost metagenome]
MLDSLVADILSRETMTVGCLGAEAILAALADNGRNDIAYYLANNTNQGCWGHWIKEYASTTALETFSDNRSSNNHAFLIGGLSAWFYKHIAGISALQPGYEKVRIKPFIPHDMNRASAQIQTVRGMVKSSWERSGKQLIFDIVIPPNATADVYVPVDNLESIMYETNSYPFELNMKGSVRQEGNYAIYSVGSGYHNFKVSSLN